MVGSPDAVREVTMLVATFGPTTAWQGREIIWDADHFILVGHGAIPAAGLLDYDRRGQLLWADPALRPWAAAVDRWERRRAGDAPGGGPAAWGASSAAAGTAAGRAPRHGIPGWVLVVAVVTALALVAAVAFVALTPSLLRHSGQTLGLDMTVRSNVYVLRTGIESFAADHEGRFPQPAEVDAATMSRYITVWPRNPYTGAPMDAGDDAGEYRYDLSPDGGAYRIIGYGVGGASVIELDGSSSELI